MEPRRQPNRQLPKMFLRWFLNVMAGQNLFKKVLLTGALVLGVCFFVGWNIAQPVQADDSSALKNLKNINEPLNTVGTQVSDSPSGIQNNPDTIYTDIGSIVSLASFFVGIVLALMIIYAGFTWLTAGGNEEKITKSKSIIVNSLIAAAIIAGAWVITVVAVYFASNNN